MDAEQRERARAILARDVERFIARGGSVKRLPGPGEWDAERSGRKLGTLAGHIGGISSAARARKVGAYRSRKKRDAED